MQKITPLLFFICLIISACGQTNNKIKDAVKQQEKLAYDTSKIAILPVQATGNGLFSKPISIQLTNEDLTIIDKLLNECINFHYSKQDTTKEFNEYVDLHKYRFQYIAAIDSTGDRKVFVNAFCQNLYEDPNYWKKSFVIVNDGGVCYFQVIINLSKNRYEQFSTNGYAWNKSNLMFIAFQMNKIQRYI